MRLMRYASTWLNFSICNSTCSGSASVLAPVTRAKDKGGDEGEREDGCKGKGGGGINIGR